MEINTHSDTDTDNNSETPLPEPHFDAAMISQAQQVELLDTSGRRKWRSSSTLDFLRGRLGVLAVTMIALLFGAAALGVVLGLRDGRSSIEEPTPANQPTPAPVNDGVAMPPIKAKPVNAPPVTPRVRTQRAELPAPETKPVSPPERVRRTVRVGLDDIDRALSQGGQKPAARKVGEIFSGSRKGDRHGRKGESKHRERAVEEPD
jgi:hypothetical protein